MGADHRRFSIPGILALDPGAGRAQPLDCDHRARGPVVRAGGSAIAGTPGSEAAKNVWCERGVGN